MKTIVKLYADQGKTEVEKLDDALYVLISPKKDAPVIPIGNRDLANAQHAISFAADAYRHQRYANALTDFLHDVHVYAGVPTDAAYYEHAGVVGPRSSLNTEKNGWYIVNLELDNDGKSALVLSRKLDPTNRCDEVRNRLLKQAENAHRDPNMERIEAAVDREAERWTGDRDDQEKHRWGKFFGYGFLVYIAHIKPWVAKVLESLNEKDDAKALEMRNEAYGNAVARKRFRKQMKTLPFNNPADATDQPDFEEEEGTEEPKEGKAGDVALLLPWIQNGALTGEMVDLMKVQPTARLWIFHIDGRGIPHDMNSWRTWNPLDKALVDGFRKWADADKKVAGIDVDQHYILK